MGGARQAASRWLPAVGLLALAALLAAAVAETRRAPPVAGPEGDRAAKGRPDAPVTIVTYADFQCPWCAREAETLRQVERDYVTRGQVRLVFRHYAVLGAESVLAARAAECAADQGAFWPFHDKLFANQGGKDRGAFSPDRLRTFAGELRLDERRFQACLASGRHRDRVAAQTAEGRARGVRLVPTLFVNGRMVEGALPYEELRPIIDEALAASRGP